MTDRQKPNKPDAFIKWSIILPVIITFVFAGIILCALMLFKAHEDAEEQRRIAVVAQIAERNRALRMQQEQQERLLEQQRIRDRAIADSIRIANMPKYTLEEVRDLVMTVAPSYSNVYLWRKDNDNWIMRYYREYGNKEHHFMQRFNPTTRKFEKAIEISTVSYPDLTESGVYTIPKNCRCSYTKNNARGYLTYYEDGKYMGVYTRDDIKSIYYIPSTTHGPLTKKRLKALESAPPDWVEEGYESVEDYYYDNAEDLYFYYREH